MRSAPAHAASRVRARRICPLPHHLCRSGPDDREESGARAAREVRRTTLMEAHVSRQHDCGQPPADPPPPECEAEPHVASQRAPRIWTRVAGINHGWGIPRTFNLAVL